MKTSNCAASPSDRGATRRRVRAWLLPPLLPPLLWLLLCAGTAAADYPLTLIDLKSRFAEDLIPILEPLAGPDGSITGAKSTLFVRAAPARLSEIRRALSTLDHPPRNLLIQVRQHQDGAQGGTRVRGAVQARIGTESHRAGGSTAASLDLDAAAGSATNSRDLTQQVRTLDGHRAYISIGQEEPVPYRDFSVGPRGRVLREGSVYQQRTSGFYVIPRVQGDQVVMEIAAGMDSPGPAGTNQTSAVEAQVQGRLGDWIPIALSIDTETASRTGTLHYAQGYRDTRTRVDLRVLPLD